jgi:hypothetical protein
MSAPLYRIHPKVISLLHERGLTVEQLAAQAQSGRCHVTQVLANKPGRGFLTRKRLAPLLTERERALLGWSAVGDLAKSATGNVPAKNSDPSQDVRAGEIHPVLT